MVSLGCSLAPGCGGSQEVAFASARPLGRANDLPEAPGHVVAQLDRTSEMFGDCIFLETIVNESKARVALMLWNEDYKKALLALVQRK